MGRARMMPVRLLREVRLAAAVILFCLVGASQGQTLRDAGRLSYDPGDAARGLFRWATEDVLVVPHLQAGWTYDDNVFISENDPVSDWSLTVTPGVSLRIGESRRNHVFASYNVDFVTYDELSREDNELHHIEVGGRVNTGKSTASVAYDFMRSRDARVEIGDRLQRDSHVILLNGETRVAPKTSVGVSARRFEDRYESDPFLDNWENRLGLRVISERTRDTDVYLEGAYGWGEYLARSAEFADFEYGEVGVGMRRAVTARTSGTAAIGYQVRTFEGDVADVEGWTGMLDLETQFSAHTTASLTGYGSIRPSIDEAGDTTLSYSLRPSVRTRLLHDRVYGVAGLEIGRFERRDRDGDDDREDDFWGFNLGVDVRVASRLTLGVDYGYTENDSTAPGFSFDRAQVTVRGGINL